MFLCVSAGSGSVYGSTAVGCVQQGVRADQATYIPWLHFQSYKFETRFCKFFDYLVFGSMIFIRCYRCVIPFRGSSFLVAVLCCLDFQDRSVVPFTFYNE